MFVTGLKMMYNVVESFRMAYATSVLIFVALTRYKETRKRYSCAAGVIVARSCKDVASGGMSLVDT
jgi:hypothetical protein